MISDAERNIWLLEEELAAYEINLAIGGQKSVPKCREKTY